MPRRIVARDAIKNAKDAKNAKNANPWELAVLAVLDRAENLTGAEAGGRPNGLWQGMLVPQFPGAPLAGGRGTTICSGGGYYM